MNINPLVSLLDKAQELVKEHGSASILRDHLALVKDQVLIREKEVVSLKENLKLLEEERNSLNHRIRALEEKLRLYESKSIDGGELNQTEVQILEYLANQEHRVTASVIAGAITANVQIVEFHLAELKKRKMVYDSIAMGRPAIWTLHHEGRRYLIGHGLLK